MTRLILQLARLSLGFSGRLNKSWRTGIRLSA